MLCRVFPSFSQEVDVKACLGGKSVYAASGEQGSTYEFAIDTPSSGELVVFDTDSLLVKWGSVTGIYRLGVRETLQSGCTGDWAYISVELVAGEQAQFAQPEYRVCGSDGVTVDFDKTAFKSWQWMDESVGDDGVISQPGVYELRTVDRNNCVSSVYATVLPCEHTPKEYMVTVSVNNSNLGFATGGGLYSEGAPATVSVTLLGDSGYNFVNWTVNGEAVSTDNPYTFTVTEDIELVANFNVLLDFDTYVATKWNNTFMLYRTTLESEGYEITGCKWYEDGVLIFEGTTYSAGPGINDLLKTGVTYYFVLSTARHGDLRSTGKVLTELKNTVLLAYPNPLRSGDMLTVEGVAEGSMIEIYSMAGIRVQYLVATGETATFRIDSLPSGVYILQTSNGQTKIVIDY